MTEALYIMICLNPNMYGEIIYKKWGENRYKNKNIHD